MESCYVQRHGTVQYAHTRAVQASCPRIQGGRLLYCAAYWPARAGIMDSSCVSVMLLIHQRKLFSSLGEAAPARTQLTGSLTSNIDEVLNPGVHNAMSQSPAYRSENSAAESHLACAPESKIHPRITRLCALTIKGHASFRGNRKRRTLCPSFV